MVFRQSAGSKFPGLKEADHVCQVMHVSLHFLKDLDHQKMATTPGRGVYAASTMTMLNENGET